MQIAKILLPLPKLFLLDYLVTNDLKIEIGDLVIVPFRNKDVTGITWEINSTSIVEKLKLIKGKLPQNLRISREMLDFISRVSAYYLIDECSVAKLVLPLNIAEPPIKEKKQEIPLEFGLPSLSPNQEYALAKLKELSKPSVIKGVTGSGKTEVYFHLIADYLQQEKQVLIMLPEISLSHQIIKRFIARFNFEPVIWNSSVTKAQKKMALRGILSGNIKMVIGARSSLFLPYNNLGLIIVDEEHDTSYKQEDGLLYNARDMAVLRGSVSNKIKVVLVSATPSIETIFNTHLDKYQLIELPSRYKEASMPSVQIIDMRQEKLQKNCWLSNSLVAAIRENLAKKEQILLFLNRRGYSPLMLCKLCGYRFACAQCSAWLVVHKSTHRLECHHCGYQSKIHTSCPECLEKDSLTVCGPGIERILEEAQHLFQDHKIEVISKDQMLKPENTKELLHKMENNEIEILIGTQIITKGYHFPNLTLVGVIDADLSSTMVDLRAGERTFQLLQQVSGRAGREHKKGRVLLQSYYPDNIVLTTLKNGSEEQFIKYELENRKLAEMPPYTKMASIILTSKNEYKAFEIAKQLVAIAPQSSARILGPAKALMSKLAGKYRYRILVVVDKKFNLQKYLKLWLNTIKIPSNCHIKIDIDPQSFY